MASIRELSTILSNRIGSSYSQIEGLILDFSTKNGINIDQPNYTSFEACKQTIDSLFINTNFLLKSNLFIKVLDELKLIFDEASEGNL